MAPSSTTLAEVDGGSIELGPSMWSIYEHGIEKNQNRLAVISAEQDQRHLEELVGPSHHDLPCLAWTYAQMRRGAVRLAATFQAHGILPGSTIALLITNSADWALLTWVAAIGRYSIEFVDPRAVEPARTEQLTYALTALKPSLVVVDHGLGALAVQETASKLSFDIKLGLCLRPDHEIPSNWRSLAEVGREDHGETIAPLTDDMQRIATYMFTSGTSLGHPKGVQRTVENWLTSTTNRSLLPISEDAIVCLTSLCFRIAANNLAICTWYLGGTVVIPDRSSDWEKTLNAIERFKVNFVQPGVYQLFPMLKNPSFSLEKVRSIRCFAIGADVITTQLLDQWQTSFPEKSIVICYGMTESTGAVGWIDEQIPNPLPTYEDVVAVGKVGPGMKIRIVASDGQVVQRGESGELHTGGRLTIPGYLDGVQDEIFYDDGDCRWMKTGDTAVVDAEGHVFVIGRSKDIIKKHGVPISPASLESCLSRQTGVRSQVIGVPDETAGEEPFGVIDHFPSGTSAERLKELIVDSFGIEYALIDIFTLETIGLTEWPKGGFDKVIKKDLKEAVIKHLSSCKD